MPKKKQAEQTAEEEAIEATEIEPGEEETPLEAEAEAAAQAKPDDEESAETEENEEEPAETEPALEEELALAREEAARNLDGWQRVAAELANFKRRQAEQQKLQRDRIKAELLEGVITALDDMELAFQNVPEELDGQIVGWVEGFRLVQRKLHRIMEEQNVMPIDTDGQFDPNFHEAISYEESEEHEEGEIIGEVRKGYQVGNRVLRPALVRVAK